MKRQLYKSFDAVPVRRIELLELTLTRFDCSDAIQYARESHLVGSVVGG
jgi:hypothetical protein